MKKKILISITVLFVVSGIIAGLLLYKSYADNAADAEPTLSEKQIKVTALLNTLITNQKLYADRLLVASEEIPIESRLSDLLAPLGAFDPIASNNGDEIQITTFTTMFGYYAASVDISKDKTMFIVESPLRFAIEDFDYKDYYKINSKKLTNLDNAMNSLDDVEVLGSWTSGMARVNNVFFDFEQGIAWVLIPGDDGLYGYKNVEFIDDDNKLMDNFSMQSLRLKDFDGTVKLLVDMYDISISTVYKCSGKTIYIIGSIGDNGFGFIKGANSAEEVNCGLLSNRFEIITDEELEDGWRFWIGR